MNWQVRLFCPLMALFCLGLKTVQGQQLVGVPLQVNSENRKSTVESDISKIIPPGGLRPLHDPYQDSDVKRIILLPAIRDRLQLETHADTAVKVSEVVAAHKQIVAGQIVHLLLRVGETSCAVGSTRELTDCEFDPAGDRSVCEIAVWERPWLNSSKVVDEKTRCALVEDTSSFKSWGHLKGATLPALSQSAHSIDSLPQNIDAQQVGLEAFNYVERGSQSQFQGQMVGYKVNGMTFDPELNVTRMEVSVEYAFTLCLKSSQRLESRSCPLDGTRDRLLCSITVIDNPNEITRLQVVPGERNELDCVRAPEAEEVLIVPVAAPCMGCRRPVPLSDPKVEEMADFALAEFDRSSSTTDHLHSMLRVLSAETQVVAGIKYYLTLELAATDCAKTVVGVDVNRTFCLTRSEVPSRICLLEVVDQPWIPIKELVGASCHDDGSDNGLSDSIIVPAVREGINLISARSGLSSDAPPSSPKLESAPPLLRGQKQSMAVDHEKVLEMAQIVASEYNNRKGDASIYDIVTIHEATSQVVAGQRYHLVLEMGQTTCSKADSAYFPGKKCDLSQNDQREMCVSDIHEQVWLSVEEQHKILSLDCQDVDQYWKKTFTSTGRSVHLTSAPFISIPEGSLGLPGGYLMQPTNETNVRDVAAFVVNQFNLGTDDDSVYVLADVISAHTQVVAGMKYLMELELAETNCKKYLPVTDPSLCPLDVDDETQICQAEVLVPLGSDGQPTEVARLFCAKRRQYYLLKTAGTGTVRSSSNDGNVSESRTAELATLVGDEFDIRSDEDEIFIVSSVVQVNRQESNDSELIHYELTVRLAETVCPKYKQKIDKSRCALDIGEELKICDASIEENPRHKSTRVTSLRCREEGEAPVARHGELDVGVQGVAIELPPVHPSSHSRPLFLSQFRARLNDDSQESLESNEKYYHARLASGSQQPQPFLDSDSDEEQDSDDRHLRFRRQIPGGYAPVNVNDPGVLDAAHHFQLHVNKVDGVAAPGNGSSNATVGAAVQIQKIVFAEQQVVAGMNYHLKVLVGSTTCPKPGVDLSQCPLDAKLPLQICDIVVFVQGWTNTREVSSMNCVPAPKGTNTR